MTSSVYPEKMESHSESGRSKTYSFPLRFLIIAAVLLMAALILVAIIFFYIGKGNAAPGDAMPKSGSATDKVTTTEMTSSTNESSAKTTEPTPAQLRLPRNTIPTHYDLKLKTYLPIDFTYDYNDRNFTFDGELSIHIMCMHKTSVIVLNSNELKIDETSVQIRQGRTSRSISFDRLEYAKKLEMVLLHLKEDLEPDSEYIISMKYTGPIAEQLSGFYRSSYQQNAIDKYIGTTQFEPTDARRALPCYDEPDLKATFKVSIVHPLGSVALSNGQDTEGAPQSNGWKLTHFSQTPKMSTYLLAFIVGDLKYNEGRTKNGVTFRVWSRPEMVEQTKYAAQVGPEVLDLYENYFDIPYPMKKQDMVALPDFDAGAMENWGLITYRENYVLYNESLFALDNKQRVAQVIAHELAHQWFGNLVTMKWWDDIWLNEGFASYMEFIGTETKSSGDFDLWSQFYDSDMSRALRADQIANSHPLSIIIQKATDVAEIFDSISYQKGASVIRMVNRVLGDANFKEGLHNYLTKFKYSNTHYTDLWNTLSDVVPSTLTDWDGQRLNVSKFMEPWTKQMGYPRIIVEIKDNKLMISQQRFKMNPEAKEEPIYQNSPFNYEWYVPINFTEYSSNKNGFAWLQPKEKATLKSGVSARDVFALNPGVYGFYRVFYDEDSWNRIIKQLKTDHKVFDVALRASLINDAFTFAEAGLYNYEVPLQLLQAYLHKEAESLPWRAAVNGLSTISKYFHSSAQYHLFKDFMQNRLQPEFDSNSLKIRTEKPKTKLEEDFLTTIFGKSCYYEVSDCSHIANQMFMERVYKVCKDEDQLSHCSTLEPYTRTTVYCNAIKTNETIFQWMWHKYKIEQNSVEQRRLMSTLTCTKDIPTLKLMLNRTMFGDEIRQQNIITFLYGVARNSIGKYLMWDFFQENFDEFLKRFKSSTGTVSSYIQAGTAGFDSTHGLQALNSFTMEHKQSEKKYSVFRKVKERIQSDIRWKTQHFDYLINIFQGYINKAST